MTRSTFGYGTRKALLITEGSSALRCARATMEPYCDRMQYLMYSLVQSFLAGGFLGMSSGPLVIDDARIWTFGRFVNMAV